MFQTSTVLRCTQTLCGGDASGRDAFPDASGGDAFPDASGGDAFPAHLDCARTLTWRAGPKAYSLNPKPESLNP
jgi:hypothetical protein